MIEILGDSLQQWEKGRKVQISCAETYTEVHFARIHDSEALIVEAKEDTADIPNILLQSSGTLRAYLVAKEGDVERTICSASFHVGTRPKPTDYVYTETEIKNYDALAERIKALEKGGGAVTNEQISQALEDYFAENGIPSGSAARIGEASLTASGWIGEKSPFSQVVNIEGVTENSQVDLTPSVEQLATFYEKDLAFVTENDSGVVTVYAIGQKPQNDYIIQVTITEVDYE